MFHSLNRNFAINGFHTFFEFKYPENYQFEGEHHQFWEAVYCLDGDVGVSSDEKIFRLVPGDLMIHQPMVHHRFWAENQTCPHVLVLSFEIEGAFPQNLTGGFSCDDFLRKQWEEIYRYIKKSGCKKSLTGFLHYLAQYPLEYQMIANLCENCFLSLPTHGLPLGINQSKKALDYKRIINVMKNNLSANLSTDEIGHICGVSVSTMKKLFRSFNSMGIHEYYLHLKISEAIQLLQSGRTVTETAAMLGFSSQSYFSTVFKRKTGENPGSFRRS